jgi:hypothetical protein
VRAHERLRDVVDAESERELEVAQILHRQRRDWKRDARDIHTLVRLDDTSGNDLAQGLGVLHAFDAEPHVAVVDEDLVTGLEN